MEEFCLKKKKEMEEMIVLQFNSIKTLSPLSLLKT